MLDFRNHGLKSQRRLKKSNTQQNLRRVSKRQKLPSLEERKAGGIVGFLKPKKKPNPLQAQIDLLCSGYIHGAPNTARPNFNPDKNRTNSPMQAELSTIRRQFIQNSGPNRLNPITHKEHYYRTARKEEERPLEELIAELEPKRHQEVEEESSSIPPTPPPETTNPKKYKNLIYHDSNSQLGQEDRYTSENKQIGRAVHSPREQTQTTKPATRSIMNKAFKHKSSLMSVFPSYGIQQDKNPFATTNQFYEIKKREEPAEFPDRVHFRQVYNMKTYMEEMLKAKNMRGEKK